MDLLGTAGDPQFEKLIASPVDFLTVLETLISDQAADDERFAMPALAAFMLNGKWTEARKVVLDSFRDFFRGNGYDALAVGLDRLEETAEMMTTRVAQSLESGELRKKWKRWSRRR